MRFRFAYLAVAAAALASCSSEETTQVNMGDAISFRSLVNGQTRALDINATNLEEFNVTAINKTTGDPYFDGVTFTKQGDGTYQSGKKYYWPTVDALNFFAYAPLQSSQVQYTDYKTFTVTPSTTVDEQVDLVYANTNDKTKAANASGVALNFRHTGSKIAVKVRNTSDNLSVHVYGWKVGYLSPSGTFTYSDANTDGKDAAFLSAGQWSNLAAASLGIQYVSNFIMNNDVIPGDANIDLPGNMILVPQQLTAATQYDAARHINGAFIAVKMIIKQNGVVIASEADGSPIWGIWPINTRWEPGKKYTYIIDVADGGYYEEDPDPVVPTPTPNPLDPILDKFIKFVDVTVDDWTSNTDIYVPQN